MVSVGPGLTLGEAASVVEARGYLVIRFRNHEVLTAIDGVIERIAGTVAVRTSDNR